MTTRTIRFPNSRRTTRSHDPVHEETSLLQRLRAGEQRAFEEFVQRYRDRMLAVARRMLRCEEDCADAVQDAFIAATQALHNFAGSSRLSTWLHRIVVNACLMRLRGRVKRALVSIEDLSVTSNAAEGSGYDISVEPDDACTAYAREETRASIRACIEHLPQTYREVILLRDIQEYDTEQTARLLGASPANVKTRLHRARQALRPMLEAIRNDMYAPTRAA